ncbi:MAG: PilZ domain-containing protein [Planctomycetota bacterium]
MLSNGKAIHVRAGTSQEDLFPGRLLISKDELPAIQFSRPTALPIGVELELLLHDQEGRFFGAPIRITRIDAAGDQPIAQIEIVGELTNRERRVAPRIEVPDDLMLVCIDNERTGSVVDISEQGMAVLIDTDSKPIGSWLEIDLTYNKRHVVGKMQAKSCKARGEGYFQYGLLANTEPGDTLHAALGALTREMHRLAEETTARAGGATQENLRRHPRRAWPGTARVFIREDTNLRVLKVNTLDLSEGGLGFSCPQPIYEGSEIVFEKTAPNGSAFCINAVVRSVCLLPGARYRVGVQFIGKALAPHELSDEIRTLMQAKAA